MILEQMEPFERPVVAYSVCDHLILLKYILHIALRLSCSVGMFTIYRISSYAKPGNIVLRHRFWIISMLSDKYLGKFVCHPGQAYSGLIIR